MRRGNVEPLLQYEMHPGEAVAHWAHISHPFIAPAQLPATLQSALDFACRPLEEIRAFRQQRLALWQKRAETLAPLSMRLINSVTDENLHSFLKRDITSERSPCLGTFPHIALRKEAFKVQRVQRHGRRSLSSPWFSASWTSRTGIRMGTSFTNAVFVPPLGRAASQGMENSPARRGKVDQEPCDSSANSQRDRLEVQSRRRCAGVRSRTTLWTPSVSSWGPPCGCQCRVFPNCRARRFAPLTTGQGQKAQQTLFDTSQNDLLFPAWISSSASRESCARRHRPNSVVGRRRNLSIPPNPNSS